MPTTTTSPNMSLPVPVVGVDPGPDWATQINNCLSIIDAHTHSSGSGVTITPSGMNINADLPLNANNLTTARSLRLSANGSPLSGGSDVGCLYRAGVDLYFNDGSGNQIRITQSGGISGTSGSIAGLVSPASATYVGATPAFVWQSAANTSANLDAGSIVLRNLTASSKGLTLSPPNAMGANYSLVLPSLPASTNFVTLDASGNFGSAANVDNSTLQFSSNVLSVKNNGITRTQLAAVGQQVSSSCGAFTSLSTTAVDITNLTVTITTTGRPVMVALQWDGTGLAVDTGSVGSIANSAAASTASRILLVRGSTTIGQYTINQTTTTGVSGFHGIEVPGSSVSTLDVVAAGTYTYKAQAFATSGSQVIATDLVLVAFEL